jgi:hypothetical protein
VRPFDCAQDRHALPNLSRKRARLSAGFRTQCFGSAMRPRIAFDTLKPSIVQPKTQNALAAFSRASASGYFSLADLRQGCARLTLY